jgi:hypothetical protein
LFEGVIVVELRFSDDILGESEGGDERREKICVIYTNLLISLYVMLRDGKGTIEYTISINLIGKTSFGIMESAHVLFITNTPARLIIMKIDPLQDRVNNSFDVNEKKLAEKIKES